MPIKLKNDPKHYIAEVLSDLKRGDTFKFSNTQYKKGTIVYMMLEKDEGWQTNVPYRYTPLNSKEKSGIIYRSTYYQANISKVTEVNSIAEIKKC